MEQESLEERVRELVYNQSSLMEVKPGRFSNRAVLGNRCQSIIYNKWGYSNNFIWELIEQYVVELIPEELD